MNAEQSALAFLIKHLGVSNEASKRQVKTKQGQILLHLKHREAVGLWGFEDIANA